MRNILAFIFILVVGINGFGQENPSSSPLSSVPALQADIEQLEKKIYHLNNAFLYDSSILLLKQKIDNSTGTDQGRYYAFLFLSYTHKRLFDYKSTLKYLDSALVYGKKTPYPAYFEANISCQKAFALFDTHRYKEADELMQKLLRTNYAYLDDEQKAKIIMQEAYLNFLNSRFELADRQYQKALHYLKIGSPCDLPMIYAKQIQLYGAINNEAGIQQAVRQSIRAADSCNILKYSLYTYEMLSETYEKKGNVVAAYKAFKHYDSLSKVYKQGEYLSNLKDMEVKYQNEKFEIKSKLDRAIIRNQQNTVFILLSLVLIMGGLVAFYELWQRQKRLRQEKENNLNFTRQLLESTEEERRRIAGDLHDSISHDLLSLKTSLSQDVHTLGIQIDTIINDIRNISRNLHPVMFDKIGLVPNIEALIERLQTQNDFMVSTDIEYNNSLNSATELQMYRIIQEALSNVIKYAKAHAAKITISESNDKFLLQIRDNGQGFKVKEKLDSGKAFGLHNIIERSRVIGGEAKITSSPEGTVINIEIPKKQV